MSSQILDSLDNDQLFSYLELQGIDCTKLKKVRNHMNEERLRQSLYRLHEKHITRKVLIEFGNRMKATSRVLGK